MINVTIEINKDVTLSCSRCPVVRRIATTNNESVYGMAILAMLSHYSNKHIEIKGDPPNEA